MKREPDIKDGKAMRLSPVIIHQSTMNTPAQLWAIIEKKKYKNKILSCLRLVTTVSPIKQSNLYSISNIDWNQPKNIIKFLIYIRFATRQLLTGMLRFPYEI